LIAVVSLYKLHAPLITKTIQHLGYSHCVYI